MTSGTILAHRFAPRPLLLGIIAVLIAVAAAAGAAEEAASLRASDLRLFLALAEMARDSYDDDADELAVTPSGCAALIREDGRGNLIVAFRGSMLADRDPDRKPFSNLGGKIIRRNYRDWVATNLKQTAGFLPRQYIEAAELVMERIRSASGVRRVFITGHSKGGGAAEYAAVNAWLALGADNAATPAIIAVTFNAAVVREKNWRRLYRTHDEESVRRLREGSVPRITAVAMRDDPVSKIAERERPAFTRVVELVPTRAMSAGEQHGINVVIEELERLLATDTPIHAN